AGLAHVDLRMIDGINIVDLPVDHARQTRAALDEAGIAVNMFGSPIGKLDVADDFDVDLRRLEHLALMAEVFDCRAVRMFSYYNKRGMATGPYEKAVLDRLARLRDRAATLALVLYHENEH